MTTTYRKTAKGTNEVAARSHGLAPRLRSTLIIVDGRKTDEELLRLLPQAAESLAALLAGGFIEAVAPAAPVPQRTAPTAPAAPAPPGAAPAASAGSAAAPTAPPVPAPAAADAPTPAPAPAAVPFETARQELLRLFNDRVGPAGEALALRMEKARSAEELRALLPQAVQLVGTLAGRGAAAEFIARAERI
jgi:hypothetical protein